MMIRSATSVFLIGAIGVVGCKGEPPSGPPEEYPYDIVFERRADPTLAPELALLDLSTGEARRLLATGVGGMHPNGSTTGDQIVFSRSDAQFVNEIFVANRDGTGLVNVSNNAAADIMPALSPAGGRVAFVTSRDGFEDIFIANLDGSSVRRLTMADPAGAVTTEWWPAWSPNGQLIAYSTTIDGTADIWTTTVDAPTIERRRLTGTPDTDIHPTWHPNGQQIAFERHDVTTGESDIVVVTFETGAVRTISMPGAQVAPAWSPNGNLIAFASNHEGGTDLEICTMTPEGTEVRCWTDNGVFDSRPTWLRK